MIFLQNVSNFIGQTLTPLPHPPALLPLPIGSATQNDVFAHFSLWNLTSDKTC